MNKERYITINLTSASGAVLHALAESSRDEEVLRQIFEIAELREDRWLMIRLATNKNPEIKSIMEKIEQSQVIGREIYRTEFARNPYTPERVLRKMLKCELVSDALYNPNTPADALNDCFPELFKQKAYICKNVVHTNGGKLSSKVLEQYIKLYPEFDEPKRILKERGI